MGFNSQQAVGSKTTNYSSVTEISNSKNYEGEGLWMGFFLFVFSIEPGIFSIRAGPCPLGGHGLLEVKDELIVSRYGG